MTDFEKMNFKITWIKAGALVVSACIVSFTVGIQLEGWNEFRRQANETLTDYKQFKSWAQPKINKFTADKNKMATNP